MTNKVKKLIEILLNDEEYMNYDSTYKSENYIDKKLLASLLNKHLDLYSIFLKINILLYRYDTKNLNKDLKDYKHYKGKLLYIDDIDIVLGHYFNHYSRCKKVMNIIITYKLRPASERKLLKMIIDRPLNEEIKPFPNFDEN